MADSPEVVQARKEERIAARFDRNESDIKELHDGQVLMTRAVSEIKSDVSDLKRAFGEQAAVARAVAEQAQAAAEKAADKAASALTQKGLIITLGLFFVALAGLLVGVHGTG